MLCMLLAATAFARQKDEIPLDGLSKRNDLSGLPPRLARMTFVHAGNDAPRDFVQTRRCVVGNWQYQSETKTHWVGMLIYPSNNYEKNSTLFGMPARIRKSADVKVDMTTWKGRMLLETKPSKGAAGAKKPATPEFTVIGYDATRKVLNDGVMDLQKVLPYAPRN